MNKENLDKLKALIEQGAGKNELQAWLNDQYYLLYTIMPGSEEDKWHSVEREADTEPRT
jgi:hypothetical protein